MGNDHLYHSADGMRGAQAPLAGHAVRQICARGECAPGARDHMWVRVVAGTRGSTARPSRHLPHLLAPSVSAPSAPAASPLLLWLTIAASTEVIIACCAQAQLDFAFSQSLFWDYVLPPIIFNAGHPRCMQRCMCIPSQPICALSQQLFTVSSNH